MDVDKRNSRSIKSQKKSYKGKLKNDALKVVYISSPMKVKTSASKFRSLVQELTGKNSDISQYMDDNSSNDSSDFYDFDRGQQLVAKETTDNYHQTYSSVSQDETPTSSNSFPGPIDDNVFVYHMKEQFEGIFSSNSFYDPLELDVLGSFGELL